MRLYRYEHSQAERNKYLPGFVRMCIYFIDYPLIHCEVLTMLMCRILIKRNIICRNLPTLPVCRIRPPRKRFIGLGKMSERNRIFPFFLRHLERHMRTEKRNSVWWSTPKTLEKVAFGSLRYACKEYSSLSQRTQVGWSPELLEPFPTHAT